jgi:pyruvate dehydrogenase E1 component alpha subunit
MVTERLEGPTELDLTLHETMLLIRRFEEAAYRAYEAGEIAGSIHASIGQEAVAVGVVSALEPDDRILSHHRAHGHALARGVDPGRLMAELLGRAEGVSRGRGGSMHVTDTGSGFLGSLAVVGGSVPVAVGVALAAQVRGLRQVCVAFFGDGAINQGVLYESLNLAGIWQLPVLFVCENNGFAISVRADYATGGPGLVARASAFGVHALEVDGQDVRAVRAAASELLALVRDGQPAVLECKTHRFMGHSRGDPPHGLYRSQEEVEASRQRDPLLVHEAAAGLLAQTLERLEERVATRIDAALSFARAAPEPDPSEALEDVWGP